MGVSGTQLRPPVGLWGERGAELKARKPRLKPSSTTEPQGLGETRKPGTSLSACGAMAQSHRRRMERDNTLPVTQLLHL